MAELSDYLENKFLNHLLRGDTGGTAFTQPATIYLALHTADPTDAGGGAEVSGGSYARQVIVFGAASAGTSTNTNTPAFTNLPTATVTHIALWDASTSGNLLMHSSISSIAFNSGDGANVAAAAISVTLS